MAQQKQPTFKDWEQIVAIRAAKNDEFRQEFLANPKATIEKFAKRKLPADLKVQAHVNSEKELHFVIADKVRTAGGELSDEDLESVAGGEFVLGATIFVTAAVTSAGLATAGGGIASAFADW